MGLLIHEIFEYMGFLIHGLGMPKLGMGFLIHGFAQHGQQHGRQHGPGQQHVEHSVKHW